MCAQFGDEFALAILAITRLCHDENATVGPNLADKRSEVVGDSGLKGDRRALLGQEVGKQEIGNAHGNLTL